MERFRGELAFQAHRLCVSLNSRLESGKTEEDPSPIPVPHVPHNYLTETCSESEAGSHLRLIDFVYNLIAELDGKGVVERVVEVLPEAGCGQFDHGRAAMCGVHVPFHACNNPRVDARQSQKSIP